MGALLFLTLVSTKNRVRSRLRRLREVRYAAGLVAGLAYFYFLLNPRGRSTGIHAAFASLREPIEMVAAVGVFLVVLAAWVWPSDGQATLSFSRAEVQFLFPAPFTRRQLISYKLLRMQLGALLSSAIVTVFFRPATLAAGWMFLAGFALLTSVLIVHLTAVSLSRASLREHGWYGLARQWLPVAVMVGSVGILAIALASAWGYLGTLDGKGAVMWELQRLSTHGAAGVVLWPCYSIARLPLAPTPAAFFTALPVPLAFLVLNFAWAVRTDAAFEEASAALAERVASVRRGARPVVGTVRRRPVPFHLSATGPGEVALLWKNLIMIGRYATLARALTFLPAVAILGVMVALNARHTGLVDAMAFFCLLLTFVTILMGPMMIRNDLRRDLERIAVLKSWPIRGAALVRGEVLAPTVVLTAFAWAFILGTSTSLAHVFREVGLSAGAGRMSYVVAALLLAPGLIAVQVLTQNAVAVMFPAWVSVGASRGQGVDVMGQRMLMMGGTLITFVVAVLPALVFGSLAGLAIYLVTSVVPVVVPAAIATASLLFECYLVTEVLGRFMDRMDPAAVEPLE